MKIILIMILAYANQLCASNCLLPQEIIEIEENEIILQTWELPDSKNLWEPYQGSFDEIDSFRFLVSDRIDPNIEAIFTRQFAFESSGDRRNINLLLSKKIGSIRPINCLEAIFFNIQAKRKPMFNEPTEFLVYILSKKLKGVGWIKIIYFTIDKPYIGRVDQAHKTIDLALTKGWRLDISLHNHNFDFSIENYRGGIAPSTADGSIYQSEKETYHLKQAFITNGFDTSEIPATNFEVLSRE